MLKKTLLALFLAISFCKILPVSAAASVALYPGTTYEFINVLNQMGKKADLDFQIESSSIHGVTVNYGGGDKNTVFITRMGGLNVDAVIVSFSLLYNDESAYANSLRHGCNALSTTLLATGLNDVELEYIYKKIMDDYVQHIPEITKGKPLTERHARVHCSKYNHEIVVLYGMSVQGAGFQIHALKL